MGNSGGVVKFFWSRSTSGYEWAEALPAFETDPKPERFLVWRGSKEPDWKGAKPQREEVFNQFPLEYRNFAKTEISEEAIAAYAFKHGMLGGTKHEDGATGVVREDVDDPKPVIEGEKFSFWSTEIQAMREAIEIWDLVRAGDKMTLEKYISWQDDGGAFYSREYEDGHGGTRRGFSLIASEGYRATLMDGLDQGDVFRAAEIFVQKVINNGLAGRVSPRLLLNDDDGEMQLCMVPSTLIGAFWLQFAMAVDKRTEYLRCQQCHDWFQPTQKESRRPQKYCSQACNMKAYRKRKKAGQTARE